MTTATLRRMEPVDAPRGASRPLSRRVSGGIGNVSGWSVLTLVLWTGCLLVGWLGLRLPYSRPQAAARLETPLQAQTLQVDLTEVASSPPDVIPIAPTAMEPPPLPEALPPPPAPPLMAVARPSPAVAFELPVEGPARLVEASRAAYVAPAVESRSAPAVAPPVQQLVFGQGEGRQPAPGYPRQALRAGQEGAVRVRFSVNEQGRVLVAEAAESSPWPLLNQAAIRTVRERWQFPAGPPRLYEVTIRFEIKK